jgi:hypothetical protein
MKYPELKSSVWLVGDLANLLRGIALAALPAGASEYQAGFQAALCAVAMALGIPFDALTLPRIPPDTR